MGFTEDQHIQLLKSRIEVTLDTEGIECSIQAFNQSGISNNCWTQAEKFAKAQQRK